MSDFKLREALQELLDNAIIQRGDHDDPLICYDRKSFIEKLTKLLAPPAEPDTGIQERIAFLEKELDRYKKLCKIQHEFGCEGTLEAARLIITRVKESVDQSEDPYLYILLHCAEKDLKHALNIQRRRRPRGESGADERPAPAKEN